MKENSTFKKFYNWTFLGVIAVALVLINIIASYIYFKIDMTEDQRYSLTDGTVSYLENEKNFKDRLSIKIYLEGENLPAEIKHYRNTLESKLKEFKAIAGDRIEYQFINPYEGSEEDQRALQENLYARGKGILPMDVMYMKDGEQSQILIWPGAVIDYQGITVSTIQFMPGTQAGKPNNIEGLTQIIDNSINNLEYILISSIRKATQVNKPRIAFLQGHGELTFAQTQRARALISPYFSIADVTLNDSLAALDNVDGLIIARPTKPFSDKDLYLIDQFVMKGGRLMCFIDALNFNEDTLNATGVTHTMRNNLGIEKMLFDYGLKLNENYVLDVKCAPKSVPFAKNSLIPWFYHVLSTPTDHPVSRNIEPVSLKYTHEIQFVGNSKNVMTPILTSSTNATVTGLAPMVSLGLPLNYGKNPKLVPNPEDENNKICLAGMAEGKFESHFKNRLVDAFAKNADVGFKTESIKNGKVFLIGNGRFIENKYDSTMNKFGTEYMYRPLAINDLRMDPELAQMGIPLFFGNQEFFQNLCDYMMGESSIVDIRSRQIDLHPMNKEKIKAEAGFYKFINVVLPLVLILVLAFVLNYLRKRKYAKK